jgi:hypothetical protein
MHLWHGLALALAAAICLFGMIWFATRGVK